MSGYPETVELVEQRVKPFLMAAICALLLIGSLISLLDARNVNWKVGFVAVLGFVGLYKSIFDLISPRKLRVDEDGLSITGNRGTRDLSASWWAVSEFARTGRTGSSISFQERALTNTGPNKVRINQCYKGIDADCWPIGGDKLVDLLNAYRGAARQRNEPDDRDDRIFAKVDGTYGIQGPLSIRQTAMRIFSRR